MTYLLLGGRPMAEPLDSFFHCKRGLPWIGIPPFSLWMGHSMNQHSSSPAVSESLGYSGICGLLHFSYRKVVWNIVTVSLLRTLILECVITYILGNFFNNLRIRWNRFEVKWNCLKKNFSFPHLVYFQGWGVHIT